MFICVDCKAEVLYGKPHAMRVQSGATVWIEQRCRLCADALAWACWDDETMGPCPYHYRHPGHA